jgi:hypothetical protein
LNKSKSKKFLLYGIAMLVICVSMLTGQVKAAVTVDNPGSSGGAFDNLGVTSLTFSHTVGEGTSRVLFVSVSTSNTLIGVAPPTRVTSVTYNGQTLH